MDNVVSIIEFVKKGVEPVPAPELPAAVQTGDIVGLLIAIVLAFAFVAMLVHSVSLRHQVADNGPKTSAKNFKRPMVISWIFALAAVVVLTTTLTGLVPRLFADEANPYVKNTDKIQAIVDEQTGQIEIEPGNLSKIKDYVYVTSLTLDYCDEIDVKDDCTWTVDISGAQVYNDKIGQTVLCDHLVENNTVQFAVMNMSQQTAVSLIGKQVVKVSFGVEKFCQVPLKNTDAASFYRDPEFTDGPVDSLLLSEGSQIEKNYDIASGTWSVAFTDDKTSEKTTLYVKAGSRTEIEDIDITPDTTVRDETQITPVCAIEKVNVDFLPVENGDYYDNPDGTGSEITTLPVEYGSKIETSTYSENPKIGVISFTDNAGQVKKIYAVPNKEHYEFIEFTGIPESHKVDDDLEFTAEFDLEKCQVNFQGTSNISICDAAGIETEEITVYYGTTVVGSSEPMKKEDGTDDFGHYVGILIIQEPGQSPVVYKTKVTDPIQYQFREFAGIPATGKIEVEQTTINAYEKVGQFWINFIFEDDNGYVSESKTGSPVVVGSFADYGSTILKSDDTDETGHKIGVLKFSCDYVPHTYYVFAKDPYEFEGFEGLPDQVTGDIIFKIKIKTVSHNVNFAPTDSSKAFAKVYDAEKQLVTDLPLKIDNDSTVEAQALQEADCYYYQIDFSKDSITKTYFLIPDKGWQVSDITLPDSGTIVKDEIIIYTCEQQLALNLEIGTGVGALYTTEEASEDTKIESTYVNVGSYFNYKNTGTTDENYRGILEVYDQLAEKDVDAPAQTFWAIGGKDEAGKDYQFETFDPAEPEKDITVEQTVTANFGPKLKSIIFDEDPEGAGAIYNTDNPDETSIPITYINEVPKGTTITINTSTGDGKIGALEVNINDGHGATPYYAVGSRDVDGHQMYQFEKFIQVDEEGTLIKDLVSGDELEIEMKNIYIKSVYTVAMYNLTLKTSTGNGKYYLGTEGEEEIDLSVPYGTTVAISEEETVADPAEMLNKEGKLIITEGEDSTTYNVKGNKDADGYQQYQLDKFTLDPESETPSLITITQAQEIDASFKYAQYLITFDVDDPDNGAFYKDYEKAEPLDPNYIYVDYGTKIQQETDDIGGFGKVNIYDKGNESDTPDSIIYAFAKNERMQFSEFTEFPVSGSAKHEIKDKAEVVATFSVRQFVVTFAYNGSGAMYDASDQPIENEKIYVDYGAQITAESPTGVKGQYVGWIKVQEEESSSTYSAKGDAEYQFDSFTSIPTSPITAPLAQAITVNFIPQQFPVTFIAQDDAGTPLGKFNTSPDGSGDEVTETYYDINTDVSYAVLDKVKDPIYQGHEVGVITFTAHDTESKVYAIGNSPQWRFDDWDSTKKPLSIIQACQIKANFKTAQYSVTLNTNVADDIAAFYYDDSEEQITEPLFFDYNTSISYEIAGSDGAKYGLVKFIAGESETVVNTISSNPSYQLSSFSPSTAPTPLIQNEVICANFTSDGTCLITFQSDSNGFFTTDSANPDDTTKYVSSVNVDPGSTLKGEVVKEDDNDDIPYEERGNNIFRFTFSKAGIDDIKIYAFGYSGYQFDQIDSSTPLPDDDEEITIAYNFKANFKTGKYKVAFATSTSSFGTGAVWEKFTDEDGNETYIQRDYVYVTSGYTIASDGTDTIYNQKVGKIKVNDIDDDDSTISYTYYAIGDPDADDNRQYKFEQFDTTLPLTVDAPNCQVDIQYSAAVYNIALNVETDDDGYPKGKYTSTAGPTSENEYTSIDVYYGTEYSCTPGTDTSGNTGSVLLNIASVEGVTQLQVSGLAGWQFNNFDNVGTSPVVADTEISSTFKGNQVVLTFKSDPDGKGAFYSTNEETPDPTKIKNSIEVDYGAKVKSLNDDLTHQGRSILILTNSEGTSDYDPLYIIGNTETNSSYHFTSLSVSEGDSFTDNQDVTATFIEVCKVQFTNTESHGNVYDVLSPSSESPKITSIYIPKDQTVKCDITESKGKLTFSQTRTGKTDYYAIPNEGYVFSSCKIDTTTITDTPITISSNCTITLNYEVALYDVTFTNDGNGAVYDTPNPVSGTNLPIETIEVTPGASIVVEDSTVAGVKMITFKVGTTIDKGPYYAVANDVSKHVWWKFTDGSGNTLPTSVTDTLTIKAWFAHSVTLNVDKSSGSANGYLTNDSSATKLDTVSMLVPPNTTPENLSWSGNWVLSGWDSSNLPNHKGAFIISKTTESSTSVSYDAIPNDYYSSGTTENNNFYWAFTKFKIGITEYTSDDDSPIDIVNNLVVTVYFEKVYNDVTLTTDPASYNSGTYSGGSWWDDYLQDNDSSGITHHAKRAVSNVVDTDEECTNKYKLPVNANLWYRQSQNGERFGYDSFKLSVSTSTDEADSVFPANKNMWTYPEGRMYFKGESNYKCVELYDSQVGDSYKIKGNLVSQKTAPENCNKITKDTTSIIALFEPIMVDVSINPNSSEGKLYDSSGNEITSTRTLSVQKSSEIESSAVTEGTYAGGYCLTITDAFGTTPQSINFYSMPNSSYEATGFNFTVDGATKNLPSTINKTPYKSKTEEGGENSHTYSVIPTFTALPTSPTITINVEKDGSGNPLGKVYNKFTGEEITGPIDVVEGSSVYISSLSRSTITVTEPSPSVNVYEYVVIANSGHKFNSFTFTYPSGGSFPILSFDTAIVLSVSFDDAEPGEIDLGIPVDGIELSTWNNMIGVGTLGGKEFDTVNGGSGLQVGQYINLYVSGVGSWGNLKILGRVETEVPSPTQAHLDQVAINIHDPSKRDYTSLINEAGGNINPDDKYVFCWLIDQDFINSIHDTRTVTGEGQDDYCIYPAGNSALTDQHLFKIHKVTITDDASNHGKWWPLSIHLSSGLNDGAVSEPGNSQAFASTDQTWSNGDDGQSLAAKDEDAQSPLDAFFNFICNIFGVKHN